MEDIFTKLGESIKTTFKQATEQTQKSVDQTVYRTELMSKKNELKKLYQDLGQEVYEHSKTEQLDEVYNDLQGRIDSLIKEIAEIEQTIDSIVNDQKDSFSSYKREVRKTWNENMAKEERPEPGPDGVEIMKICDHCNTGNHVKAIYCINCGHKF